MIGSISANILAGRYVLGGRRPWSLGYNGYKEKYITRIIRDEAVMDTFRHNAQLPPKFGYRLDERVVEYPWLFSRITSESNSMLDAGSGLNHEYLQNSAVLKERRVVVFNLSKEIEISRRNISYVYGDLRKTSLENDSFDEIVCISTLEHIGMDNSLLYSKDSRLRENAQDDYKKVLDEFKRLLKPRGKLFITVPYGRYENLGWFQQFDHNLLDQAIRHFGGSMVKVSYYKYNSGGWQFANAAECSDCRYFDYRKAKRFDPDYAAAAKAVACIELIR